MRINGPWKSTIITVLLIINLAATAFIAYNTFFPAAEPPGALAFDSAIRHVLYIGLNDKDAYEQMIPTEQAKGIVNEICAKYVAGYTLSEAQGGWLDEKGVLTRENTLVYSFSEASEAEIISIVREVLRALNQNSVLVERQEISSAYYNGQE